MFCVTTVEPMTVGLAGLLMSKSVSVTLPDKADGRRIAKRTDRAAGAAHHQRVRAVDGDAHRVDRARNGERRSAA